MNSWIIFALISAVAASLVAVFGKIGLSKVDPLASSTIRAVIMAAFLLIIFLIEGKTGAWREVFSDGKSTLFVILSALAGAVSWVFYFWALKIGETSRVAVVDRLSVVFVIILAGLFLGEKISLKVGIGASLMVAGAILAIL